VRKDQFPYPSPLGFVYDSGDYHLTLRKALDKIGYKELRKEQAEKRARGELMGIGISTFTEAVGAGPSKHFDIMGIKMFDSAEIRIHPTGSGSCAPEPSRRAKATRRPGRRSSPKSSASIRKTLGRRRRHRHRALRSGHVREPQHAGRRRGARDGGARVREKARKIAAHVLEAPLDDVEWSTTSSRSRASRPRRSR
jgi:carbon-monoxide dehydrogenase large subunit